MSLNLLDSIKNEVTSTVIDKISNYLGESRGNTSNAITAAIPTLLGFLSEKSKTESGAASLIKLATDGGLSSLFSGSSFTDVFEKNRDALMSTGNSALIDLFGDKEAKVSEEISNYANVSKEASNGILASILPLILSVLGSKISGGGFNASTLTNLFAGEKDSIFSAIPSGLASLGGLLGLGKIGDYVTDTTQKVTSTVSSGVRKVADEVKHTTHETRTYVEEEDNGGGFMKWLLPLLGILVALGLLWFLLKQCKKEPVDPVVDTDTVVVDTVVETTRVLAPVKLDSIELQAYPNGVEEQLIAFINSPEYASATEDQLKERWFNFDDLNFEFGTATLTPESSRQLDNIVAILKNYLNVKIKLGAYTDKVGDDAANLKLSQERADAVKATLDAKGVGAQITGAEGYGEQFATVDENASDEERLVDRKTSVRLAK